MCLKASVITEGEESGVPWTRGIHVMVYCAHRPLGAQKIFTGKIPSPLFLNSFPPFIMSRKISW